MLSMVSLSVGFAWKFNISFSFVLVVSRRYLGMYNCKYTTQSGYSTANIAN